MEDAATTRWPRGPAALGASSDEEDEQGTSLWPHGPHRLQRALLPALLVVAVVTAVFQLAPSPAGRGGPASLPEGAVPEQKAEPQYWHMCPSSETCGQQAMLQWRRSPASLASSVPADLSCLPGLSGRAHSQVLQRWQASPPTFRGSQVTLGAIARFMKDLLGSDPFGTGAQVPYVDFHGQGQGKVVAITQRQLAFVVANELMGNRLGSGEEGLAHALSHCGSTGSTGYVYALLSLLAVLSQELTGGQHGTVIVGATPRHWDGSWRDKLRSSTLDQPTLCIENAEGGASGCGVEDFMSGGTPFQVLAFSFFAFGQKMLPVPWTLLGSRRYMSRLTGASDQGGRCGRILEKDWLNDDPAPPITPVTLNGATAYMVAHSFVAVASKGGGEKCPLGKAKNNACASQRHHLEEDVGLWYQAFAPEMYAAVVQPAFRSLVTRIGTGPWGAGVWWGDSHQYFLAVWLATSLLAGAKLDYYVYSHFCENPGNQCLLLGAGGCKECIERAGSTGVDASYCGSASIQDVVAQFAGRTAADLHAALSVVADPPGQIFDHLTGRAAAAPAASLPMASQSPASQPTASQSMASQPAASQPPASQPTAS